MKVGWVSPLPVLPDGGESQAHRKALSRLVRTLEGGVPDARGEQSWGVAAVVGVTAGVGMLGEVAAPGRGEGGDKVVTRRSEWVAISLCTELRTISSIFAIWRT